MNILIQISLLFSLFSCGIIKTRKEYISIDSKPRGLIIYRQAEGVESINKIGTTPMFFEVPKGSQDIYMMKDPVFKNISINTTPKNICRLYRQGEQFIPKEKSKKDFNLVKSFVNSWRPKNILKGSSYECITIVKTKLKNAIISQKKKICRTYLIMPPRSSYVKVSRDLAQAWIDQVFNKQKQKCDKVITPLISEGHMLFLGIDELTGPQDITEMEYKKFINLGAKFKATDVVFLPYKQKNKLFTVNPKIYDIHTTKLADNSPNKKFKTHLDISGGYKFSNTLLSTFRFVPNGIGFQGDFRNTLHAKGKEVGPFDRVYKSFIPGISVDNIVYPQYRWKSQTLIVPYVVWQYWGEEINLDLYGIMLNIKWFWHLPPGGVFVAKGGIGPTYIYSTYDKIDYKRSVVTWIANLGADFYFFPWERIYILTGYRRFFIPEVVKGPDFAVKGESRFFLSVGYFWPEFRTAARRWLSW